MATQNTFNTWIFFLYFQVQMLFIYALNEIITVISLRIWIP